MRCSGSHQRAKQGCSLSPLLYSLYTNDLGGFLNIPERGAFTGLEANKVSKTEHAEDTALVTNTA